VAAPDVDQSFVVRARSDDVRTHLLTIAGTDGYRLGGDQPIGGTAGYGGLALHRRRIPVWAIVLAVVFFPFGLLFLLVKTEEHVTIGVDRVANGTQVSVRGRASRGLQYAIQAALAEWQVAGAPAPRWPDARPVAAPAATATATATADTPPGGYPVVVPGWEPPAAPGPAPSPEPAIPSLSAEAGFSSPGAEPASPTPSPAALPPSPGTWSPPPPPTPPLGGPPGGAPQMPLGPIGGPPGGLPPPPAAPPGGLAPLDLPDVPGFGTEPPRPGPEE
jgi:hypothetical protein